MAGGVSCGLRHFVGATEGPEQALGIEGPATPESPAN